MLRNSFLTNNSFKLTTVRILRFVIITVIFIGLILQIPSNVSAVQLTFSHSGNKYIFFQIIRRVYQVQTDIL